MLSCLLVCVSVISRFSFRNLDFHTTVQKEYFNLFGLINWEGKSFVALCYELLDCHKHVSAR